MYAQTFENPPNQAPRSASGSDSGQGQNCEPDDDTLLGSRDRIANRWYALKSVFDSQSAPVEQQPAQPPARVPVLAVFSLAGGVGKTSLVASLGRALSSRGERVLLIDTAAYGLLPFFFGARDQRPGLLRTFNPPGVSADAPIQLVTLDPEGQAPEHGPDPNQLNQEPNQNPLQTPNQDWLASEVARYTRSANRVLIDLPTASGSTTRRVLRLQPVVLVPVLPDMNSVVSVGAIEAFFRHNGTGINTGGKQILPYYVLNQFDYSLPLHLDVREILREQIGDRLLPFALRRSPAVSEALAEGMTVMDYAPNAVVAEDYANLAGWVRSLSAPATQSYRGVRWSER
jgi:cellulose synthase operon protein YhjQ